MANEINAPNRPENNRKGRKLRTPLQISSADAEFKHYFWVAEVAVYTLSHLLTSSVFLQVYKGQYEHQCTPR